MDNIEGDVMRKEMVTGLRIFLVALFALPLIAGAHAISECTFAQPDALLDKDAYHGYTFKRTANNGALEEIEITRSSKLKIQQNQCVDFIVRKYIVTLDSAATVIPVDVAIDEISNLKFVDVSKKPIELLSFLKSGRGKGSFRRFSGCRDGSSAPSGECSWDSSGGFSFDVNRNKNHLIITVTEYTSG